MLHRYRDFVTPALLFSLKARPLREYIRVCMCTAPNMGQRARNRVKVVRGNRHMHLSICPSVLHASRVVAYIIARPCVHIIMHARETHILLYLPTHEFLQIRPWPTFLALARSLARSPQYIDAESTNRSPMEKRGSVARGGEAAAAHSPVPRIAIDRLPPPPPPHGHVLRSPRIII